MRNDLSGAERIALTQRRVEIAAEKIEEAKAVKKAENLISSNDFTKSSEVQASLCHPWKLAHYGQVYPRSVLAHWAPPQRAREFDCRKRFPTIKRTVATQANRLNGVGSFRHG